MQEAWDWGYDYIKNLNIWYTPCQLEVPINLCVHYCGFRYGCGDYNPYETYLKDLACQVPVARARARFVDFLRYYRPRHMAQALGLGPLSQEYPLWIYPWQRFAAPDFNLSQGWHSDPDSAPDILTNFSEDGVLSFRIEEEFLWLDRTLHSISKHGYQSDKFECVTVLRFCRTDGNSIYLLLDGNHRVSALSALGFTAVRVRQRYPYTIYEHDSHKWYGVKEGFYRQEDALKIFNAYFYGNHDYRTTQKPAHLVGYTEWSRLYE